MYLDIALSVRLEEGVVAAGNETVVTIGQAGHAYPSPVAGMDFYQILPLPRIVRQRLGYARFLHLITQEINTAQGVCAVIIHKRKQAVFAYELQLLAYLIEGVAVGRGESGEIFGVPGVGVAQGESARAEIMAVFEDEVVGELFPGHVEASVGRSVRLDGEHFATVARLSFLFTIRFREERAA